MMMLCPSCEQMKIESEFENCQGCDALICVECVEIGCSICEDEEE